MKLRTNLLTLCIIAFLFAGWSEPQGLSVGDKATDFALSNVDGKEISFNSFENAKGYIVIFTCNNCPYAKAYQERIAALHTTYASKGFPVIAINTSDSEADIRQRARERKYPFVYLHDKTQEVSRAYGATKTPHVYVLTRDKTVAYIGAIDNNYKDAEAADAHYVKDAVEALLANKEVKVKKTNAIGCTINWKTS